MKYGSKWLVSERHLMRWLREHGRIPTTNLGMRLDVATAQHVLDVLKKPCNLCETGLNH